MASTGFFLAILNTGKKLATKATKNEIKSNNPICLIEKLKIVIDKPTPDLNESLMK